MIDLSSVQNIHFIGIGGVSNSAIAEILRSNGFHITGSDANSSRFTEHLRSIGIPVSIGHNEANIKQADLVVYTSAVSDDNPELCAASAMNIPCLSRAEMLGQLMLGYPDSVAISGTHGKTTTTSMVAHLLNDTHFDPTALVGGHFKAFDGTVRIGKSSLFITEACEYKESFISFYPKIAVILNIDEDHLDYYNDLDHIVNAFVKFTQNINEDGLLIINGDDYQARKVLPHYQGSILSFGLTDSCDLKALNVTYNQNGCATFDLMYQDKVLSSISLSVPGQHNVYNALAALAVCMQFTQNIDLLKSRLFHFENAHRRFEKVGSKNGYTVIDDYAHHPNEIKATLDAAQKMTHAERIITIFQPHTYSRTKELMHGFASAFKKSDIVIVCDIYAARETDPGDIHASDLVNAISNDGTKAIYSPDFASAVNTINALVKPGDLIITMGAGDVNKIAKLLIE